MIHQNNPKHGVVVTFRNDSFEPAGRFLSLRNFWTAAVLELFPMVQQEHMETLEGGSVGLVSDGSSDEL